MGHDEHCEGRVNCNCATRAYAADPMLDEDGRPIALESRYGTAAPWAPPQAEG